MVLSPKVKILIGAAILSEIILVIWGITYRINYNRDYELVAGDEFDGSAVTGDRLENPPFPTSFANVEISGFQAASTGRVYNTELKDRDSGEKLGTATILEVVSRDRGDPDNLISLKLIVQFAPEGNPNHNLMPWVLKRATELSSSSIQIDSSILPEEKVKEIFPRGTVWSFAPLADLGREELNQMPELLYYAERYYGGKSYPEVEKLFLDSPDHHALLGKVSLPIFTLDVFEYLTQFFGQ